MSNFLLIAGCFVVTLFLIFIWYQCCCDDSGPSYTPGLTWQQQQHQGGRISKIQHSPYQQRYLEPMWPTSVLPTTGKQLVSPIRHFNPHQNKKFARVQPCTSQQSVAIKEDKPPPLVVKKDQDVKIQEEDSKDEDITFSPGGEVAVATQMWNDFIYISMP